MSALIDRYTLGTLTRQITDFVAAYLIALIAAGGLLGGPSGAVAVAKIILAIKLSVFALPLAHTAVFSGIPPWAWYVIVCLWIVRFAFRAGYTTEDFVTAAEQAYYRHRGTTDAAPETAPVATDGGEKQTATVAERRGEA